jgi:hypothetical protein
VATSTGSRTTNLSARLRRACRFTQNETLYGARYGNANLLDGRNRREARLKIGYKWRMEDFKMFTGSLSEAEVYVYSVNSLRRHLSKE